MTLQLISKRILSGCLQSGGSNSSISITSCIHTQAFKQPLLNQGLTLSKQIILDGRFLSNALPTNMASSILFLHTSAVVERARQSTRIRKRKVAEANKKKKEERLRKNPPPLPKKVVLMLKSKGMSGKLTPWRTPDEKLFPTDDVWFENWFTHKRLSVAEAIGCLREHYHPSMLDRPDALVHAKIEFNLAGAKRDRYLEPFNKMVPIYHPFERGVAEKSIMVFSKNPEICKEAEAAGATKAGGPDLIEDIVKGKVEVIDFDYFLAHDDISLELKPLIGMLRDKLPSKQNGTVGSDIVKLVKTYSNGQLVLVKKPKATLGYSEDPSYGFCEAVIGRLPMKEEEIEGNLTTLLEFLREKAPNRAGGFVTRCDLFVDDRLRRKFPVHHDLIDDAKYKNHVKSLQSQAST